MPVIKKNIDETFLVDLEKDHPEFGTYAEDSAQIYVASYTQEGLGAVTQVPDFEDGTFGDCVALQLSEGDDRLIFRTYWTRSGQTKAAIIRKARVLGNRDQIRETKSTLGEMEWVSTYAGPVPFGLGRKGADVAIQIDMYGEEEDDAHFVFEELQVTRETLDSGIETLRIKAAGVHAFTESQQGYYLRLMAPDGELIYSADQGEWMHDHCDFGSTAVNGGDEARQFRIRNLGNKDAAFGHPIVEGEGFRAKIDSHRRVAPKMESEYLRVIFNPDKKGLNEAKITLPMASNQDETAISFHVKGWGE